MAEAEKSKDRERSRSPIDEESSSEDDSDSSMTTSDGELEGDVESMDDTETGRKADGKDSEKKVRPFRSSRSSRAGAASKERGSQNSRDLARERQQRLLNLLFPPWMRLGASRWAGAGGIASHTSRSVKRKREEGGSDEEGEGGEKSEPVFERKFFWTCNKDTGFPHRVNHAVAGHRCEMCIHVCVCIIIMYESKTHDVHNLLSI